MSQRPLSDEQAHEAVALLNEHGNASAASRAAGIPRETFSSRLKVAALRGFMGYKPVLPGFEVKQTSTHTGPDGEVRSTSVKQVREPGPVFEMPEGLRLKGVTALVDAEGRVLHQHIMGRPGARDPRETVEYLKTAFSDFKPCAKPIKVPAATSKDLLTLFPCGDWHFGMFSWSKEVGGENWDLKIAEKTIGRGVEDVVARSPRSGHAIVLSGGDLLHADNVDNHTAKSKNTLDVDGRYKKVLLAASHLMVRTVDANLRRHGHVTVRVLPGNHDEHSAASIAYFLLAWYRNEPRVTVDVDPSLFFWYPFGKVFIGATHGHTVKLKEMAAIMAHRRPEEWGRTKHRYIHGFHLHHTEKIATEGNGVISEIHQAPIPQDAWHYGAGFLSGRSLQAITYHKELGEIGRVRVAMLDAGNIAK